MLWRKYRVNKVKMLIKYMSLRSSLYTFTFLVLFSLTLICLFQSNVEVMKNYLVANSTIEEKRESNIDSLYLSLLDDDLMDFEGFDNESGANRTIVPNIVHLIYFNHTRIKFTQMINIFSIYINTKPDFIYFHCDNCSFHGKYWHQLNEMKRLRKIIRIHRINASSTIFGIKYGFLEHKSDVYRILALMHYGGIYLDNDVYVVNSLDKYRRFEMTGLCILLSLFFLIYFIP